MNVDYVAIGQRVRKSRKNLKLTQEKLAETIGLTSVYISRIENGKAKMSLDTILRLSQALNINPGYLLSGIFHYSQDNTFVLPELIKNCSIDTLKTMIKILVFVIREQQKE